MPGVRKIVFVVGLMALAATAQAEVFKCKGADGKVVFSDHACAADQTSSSVPGIPKSTGKPAVSADQAPDPNPASAAHDDNLFVARAALQRLVGIGLEWDLFSTAQALVRRDDQLRIGIIDAARQ